MTIRILNSEPEGYCDPAREILQKLGAVDELSLNRSGLLEVIGGYDVLIVRLGFQVDREVLEAGKKLKTVVSATTGLDHIDMQAASEMGIEVLSLRGETEFLRTVRATAELTWGLVLSLLRNLPQAFDDVNSGNWDRQKHRGYELSTRRLGIVGCGRLGSQVAKYGLAFAMEVATYDPFQQELPADVVGHENLHEMLAQCDVVSLHVPLNDKTTEMFSSAEFKAMKRGAVFVNTSRGALVDEAALLDALKTGHLSGAALDVVQNEAAISNSELHPLVEYAKLNSNLIITPHIGGATFDSMARTEIFMAEKLAGHLKSN